MKSRKLTCVVALILFAAVPTVLASTTWYVNGVSGSNLNNCLSTTTACKTIGHAISLAHSGDTINVAAATYYENLTIGVSMNLIGTAAATIIDGQCLNTVVTIPTMSASVLLSNLTIRHGCAPNAGLVSYAGGISNHGTLRILASTILQNTASIGYVGQGVVSAGGIANSGTLTISNSTLTGNMAKISCRTRCAARGGGISSGGTLIINNSTISGNVAYLGSCSVDCIAYGGGIYSGGTLIINNSTLSGNTANRSFGGGAGGGIYNDAGTVTVKNSIVANSVNGNCYGTVTSKGYNLSSDTTCNFNGPGDMNNINPMLGPLQNNGGPTQTMALPSGSPAIDAGNPSGCTDGQGHLLKTDQRGFPRHDPEDTRGCDMGAYERQGD
jgi:hypothetical protein